MIVAKPKAARNRMLNGLWLSTWSSCTITCTLPVLWVSVTVSACHHSWSCKSVIVSCHCLPADCDVHDWRIHVHHAHHKHQPQVNKYFATVAWVGNSTNEATKPTCTNHVTHYVIICIIAIQARSQKFVGEYLWLFLTLLSWLSFICKLIDRNMRSWVEPCLCFKITYLRMERWRKSGQFQEKYWFILRLSVTS